MCSTAVLHTLPIIELIKKSWLILDRRWLYEVDFATYGLLLVEEGALARHLGPDRQRLKFFSLEMTKGLRLVSVASNVVSFIKMMRLRTKATSPSLLLTLLMPELSCLSFPCQLAFMTGAQ